eukprot:6381543-Amphidinium_carterae.1
MMKEGCLKEHVPSLLMKVLYCARMCRPDLSWTIGTLSRRITKWTRHDDLHCLATGAPLLIHQDHFFAETPSNCILRK